LHEGANGKKKKIDYFLQPLSNDFEKKTHQRSSARAGGLGVTQGHGLLLWILTDRDICISGVIPQHEEICYHSVTRHRGSSAAANHEIVKPNPFASLQSECG